MTCTSVKTFIAGQSLCHNKRILNCKENKHPWSFDLQGRIGVEIAFVFL